MFIITSSVCINATKHKILKSKQKLFFLNLEIIYNDSFYLDTSKIFYFTYMQGPKRTKI